MSSDPGAALDLLIAQRVFGHTVVTLPFSPDPDCGDLEPLVDDPAMLREDYVPPSDRPFLREHAAWARQELRDRQEHYLLLPAYETDTPQEGRHWLPIPAYSTDVGAAMLILDQWPTDYTLQREAFGGLRFVASLFFTEPCPDRPGFYLRCHEAIAPTLPLAICRAALIAAGHPAAPPEPVLRSGRLKNLLARSYLTVAQAQAMTDRELRQVRGMGKGTLAELRALRNEVPR